MTSQSQPSISIVWHQVFILERFSSVLYPLDVFELLKQLPTIGYVVPDLVLRGTPEPGKPLATKGDVDFIINQDNKTLGVAGRDVEKAFTCFHELRSLCLDRLDPSPGLVSQYIEFNGNGWVKSGGNPTEVFAKCWANQGLLQDMGGLLGTEVTNFGFELVPPNGDPNSPDWFSIHLQPLAVSSHRRYRVRWIWRQSDIRQFLDKPPAFDEILKNLIAKLERY